MKEKRKQIYHCHMGGRKREGVTEGGKAVMREREGGGKEWEGGW